MVALFPIFIIQNAMDNEQRKYMLLGLRIVGDFGATIAVPVVLFVLVGQWMDARYGIGPWATVAAFVLAALVSGKSIYRKAKEYGRTYTAIDTKEEKK
ncbi:MAG TPA: AtpZ/AtpI family protein [Candidatus Kapabacteria bacterium]|nr:AtpZ/AtpI family protein [Candidatus Kapabacteria bacterium]